MRAIGARSAADKGNALSAQDIGHLGHRRPGGSKISRNGAGVNPGRQRAIGKAGGIEVNQDVSERRGRAEARARGNDRPEPAATQADEGTTVGSFYIGE